MRPSPGSWLCADPRCLQRDGVSGISRVAARRATSLSHPAVVMRQPPPSSTLRRQNPPDFRSRKNFDDDGISGPALRLRERPVYAPLLSASRICHWVPGQGGSRAEQFSSKHGLLGKYFWSPQEKSVSRGIPALSLPERCSAVKSRLGPAVCGAKDLCFFSVSHEPHFSVLKG